jgi:iduronate 2-sulfatase
MVVVVSQARMLLLVLQLVACADNATARRLGFEAKRRNVLLVVYDDLSARHNVYGWKQSATPVADKFAEDALVFDRAYCQQAVCSPSRASFLSGRRPDRTQQWTFALPPPNVPGTGGWRNAPGASQWRSFPQWFKDHGYYTAGAGKL